MPERLQKKDFSSYALAYVDFLLYLCSGNRERSVMSPTFLKEKGYSFKIYSNEEVRMHIHIIKDNKEAKFWLEPQVELAYKGDFSQHEINKIQTIVELYAEYFKKQYQLHIGGRVDD